MKAAHRAKQPRGFSLVELLVVIAIMAAVIGLAVPAFHGPGASRSLSKAGTKVADLANLARQNSMSKNGMTALLVVTDEAVPERNRLIALFELIPPSDGAQASSANWRQISKWETLDNSIVVDQTQMESFPESNPIPAFPTIRYGNKSIRAFQYAIFLPRGNLLNNNPAQMRLVEGYFAPNSNNLIYMGRTAGGIPSNYYLVTVIAATGRTKIDQP